MIFYFLINWALLCKLLVRVLRDYIRLLIFSLNILSGNWVIDSWLIYCSWNDDLLLVNKSSSLWGVFAHTNFNKDKGYSQDAESDSDFLCWSNRLDIIFIVIFKRRKFLLSLMVSSVFSIGVLILFLFLIIEFKWLIDLILPIIVFLIMVQLFVLMGSFSIGGMSRMNQKLPGLNTFSVEIDILGFCQAANC